MADDKGDTGPQDRTRIDPSQDHEARYWTDKLGISRSRLEEVVRMVGPSAAAVEEELRKQTLATGRS